MHTPEFIEPTPEQPAFNIGWANDPISITAYQCPPDIDKITDEFYVTTVAELSPVAAGGVAINISHTHHDSTEYECSTMIGVDPEEVASTPRAVSKLVKGVHERLHDLLDEKGIPTVQIDTNDNSYDLTIVDPESNTYYPFSVAYIKPADKHTTAQIHVYSGITPMNDSDTDASIFNYNVHEVDQAIKHMATLGIIIGNAIAKDINPTQPIDNTILRVSLLAETIRMKREAEQAATLAMSTSLVLYEKPYLEQLVDFPDIQNLGGIERHIARIRQHIEDFKVSPELAKKYRLKPPGGILLYGPGGSGKTELARSTAREYGLDFREFSVSDITQKYVGDSEILLRTIFDNAAAEDHDVMLFFDEFDGITSETAGGNKGKTLSLVAEFKKLLENRVKYHNVLVLCAANSIANIDSNLLRPGRFDTVIEMTMPDEDDRKDIFHSFIMSRLNFFEIASPETPLAELTVAMFEQEDENYTSFARASEGFTGADIVSALSSLLRERMRYEERTGTEGPKIDSFEILRAITAHRRNRPTKY